MITLSILFKMKDGATGVGGSFGVRLGYPTQGARDGARGGSNGSKPSPHRGSSPGAHDVFDPSYIFITCLSKQISMLGLIDTQNIGYLIP